MQTLTFMRYGRALVGLFGMALGAAQPILAASPAPCRLDGPAPPYPALRLESIAKGFDAPLGLYHAGDGSGRLFIVEQRGTIQVWKKGQLAKKPFLDIRERVTAGGELGLLGLAFHPNFPHNGRFFVNYTSRTGGLHTTISEFRVSDRPDEADSRIERILLSIPQPYSNHNGGNIVFGPDGMLYIGMGDGGSANDPHGNGQNLSTLLGKMLRIDVDPANNKASYGIPPDNPFAGRKQAAPEIWAYGLRNPWRFSFDPDTGRLYAGDVGQNAREEIDVIDKAKNYGWNIMEGTICTPGVNPACKQAGLELPILDYPRSEGTTVIGGYVYRGRAIPDLCGAYVYGDFGNGRIWGLRDDGQIVISQQKLLDTGRKISSFGEDEQRELYAIDYAGEVLKIVP
ncbi:MAG: PQQ-dependent sugar dehydrogenase [Nitrospirae bacterium]|nr:PQQ-dependent sugar dehydrogenase [Nitrospirota bacterium]